MCTVQVRRPEGQSPDLTSSKHREVQLTRSAALARAAGKRLRRAADPSGVPGRAAAAGAHDAWPGRARVRSTWLAGRRERRERERGARAVRSRRAPRAAPTRPRHLLSSRGTGPAPRRLVPAGLEPPGGVGRSWPGAFGRSKNKSRARPAHRARDAARAARGRRAARKICVFEAPAPRSGGRAVRRGARARRARVGSGAGPPGGARGAAPASGRARAGRWRRPARRGAAAGRRHFRCSLCFITVDAKQ